MKNIIFIEPLTLVQNYANKATIQYSLNHRSLTRNSFPIPRGTPARNMVVSFNDRIHACFMPLVIFISDSLVKTVDWWQTLHVETRQVTRLYSIFY